MCFKASLLSKGSAANLTFMWLQISLNHYAFGFEIFSSMKNKLTDIALFSFFLIGILKPVSLLTEESKTQLNTSVDG